MAVELTRHRFTLEQYERMIETGVLTDRDRVELIEGEIIERPPIGDPHAGTCNRIAHPLFARLGTRAIIAVANPVALPIVVSMPQPDHVREPRDGSYQSVRTIRRGASIAPLAFPDVSFGFADLLG